MKWFEICFGGIFSFPQPVDYGTLCLASLCHVALGDLSLAFGGTGDLMKMFLTVFQRRRANESRFGLGLWAMDLDNKPSSEGICCSAGKRKSESHYCDALP